MKIKKNEILFFVGLYILMFRMIFNSVTFIELSELTQNLLLLSGSLCLLLKILTDSERLSKILKYLCILIVLFLNYLLCGESIVFITFLIIIASKNIELKKILKVMCVTLSALLLTLVLVYLVAYIFDAELLHYNIRKVEGTDQVRHTFFFKHANVFSSILCWTYFMYLYYKYEKIGALDKIILCLIALFIYIFPNSRTTAIIMILFLFVLWGYKKFKDTKIMMFIIKNIWIICILVSIVCLALHENTVVQKIDTILSGRINAGYYAYNIFGITWFGRKFPVNYALQVSQTKWIMNLVIDNLYYRLILVYGIVMLLFLTYMITKVISNEVKNKNEKNVVFLILLCLFGLMETIPLQVMFAFPMFLIRDEI